MIRRRLLNQDVVRALRDGGQLERARLLHHAAEAGDVATLLEEGPAAAREAARAGSHRQALAHFEAVMAHAGRLEPRERAALLDDYGWELYNAHRFRDAVDAGRDAARLYEELEDRIALAHCLVRLSRPPVHDRRDRRRRGLRAPRGPDPAHRGRRRRAGLRDALPRRDPGADGQSAEAMPVLEHADRLALYSERPDLAALCLNYLAIARFEDGDAARAGHDAQQHRDRPRRRAPRGDRARLHEPRRAAVPRRAPDRARALRARRAGVHARARLLVARLQPRDPPLPAAAAPRRVGRGGARAARADRVRRGRGDRLRLQRPVAGAAAGPPRRPGGRRAAGRGVGAGEARSGCCSGSRTPGWRARNGRGWRASRTPRARSPRCCCRASSTAGAAPFRGELLRYLARAGLPGRAVRALPARVGGRPGRRLAHRGRGVAARRRSVRGGAGAGRGRRRGDRRGPADRSTGSAPSPPRSGPARGCASSARGSRRARVRRRRRTRRG